MNEKGWERPFCLICDFWWILLVLLVLGLAAFFTRSLWLPRTLGTGDVQVTLRWSGQNDLDLHVTDPANENISYQHPQSASKGVLDVDSNAGCASSLTESPVENIYWPTGQAPRGKFKVAVNFYAKCTDILLTSFTVRVLVDGKEKEFSGQVDAIGKTVPVFEFVR